MKLFSIDINICATAYIKAEDEAEAMQIARRNLVDCGLELSSRHQEAGDGHGRPYECLAENEEEIALSPAMTITGLAGNIYEVDGD